MKPDYVKNDEWEFADQLRQFANGLGVHGVALGFDPAEITSADDDAKFYKYALERQADAQAYGQDFTRFKNIARHGDMDNPTLGAFPQLIPFPSPTPAVVGIKIEARFRARAEKAKNAAGYNQGIGETLDIVAAEIVFAPEDGKPVLKLKHVEGGYPHLHTPKGQYEGFEVHRLDSRTDTEFKKIDTSVHPNYIDHLTLPAAGQSALIKYKVIYIYKGNRVGDWSDIGQILIHSAS